LGKIHISFLTAETIVWCTHHRPNTFCPNFGSYIWQNPIQLFDDIFHPFLEGVGVGGGVKAILGTAAAVKKQKWSEGEYCKIIVKENLRTNEVSLEFGQL